MWNRDLPRLLGAAAFYATLAAGTAQANPNDIETGGKLLLTSGVSSVEGTSGGGLANWSVIAGGATEEGVGAAVHLTHVELHDYSLQSYGFKVGIFDRVELSYARHNFNTLKVGAALGLGENFKLNQDIFGAKLRVIGDAVYGHPILPQIAVGSHYYENKDAPVTNFVGAKKSADFDFYVAATKLILSESILVNGTARLTRANQFGLLGFGGDKNGNRSLQIEASAAYQLSRRFVLGGEFRSKPDNLSIAAEDDAFDIFAAWAINRNMTVTAAYVDLGNIVIKDKQRGAFLSLQASF